MVSVSPVFTSAIPAEVPTEVNLFRQVLRTSSSLVRTPGETVTSSLPRTAVRGGALAARRAHPQRLWRGPRQTRHHRERQERRHRDLRRRLRRHGRAGRRGQEGGQAQRHRPAPRLGELRRADRRLHRRSTASRSTVENPDGASQDEINAVTSRKGQDRAPDVLDLGSSLRASAAQQGLLAPYKVAAFDDIPARQKDAAGALVQRLRRLHLHRLRRQAGEDLPEDLRRPAQAPSTRARSRSTATRPSRVRRSAACTRRPRWPTAVRFDDIQPGLDFFAKLKKNGNYTPGRVDPGHRREGRDADQHRLGLPQRRLRRGVQGQGRRLEGVRARPTASTPSTTPRPSTRTPRTRPPPGCGRSTSTAPRARTSGSRASPGRC